jgi:small subunit ribosomal protein S21
LRSSWLSSKKYWQEGVISLPKVVKRNNETDESLLRRFRKAVTKAGTMGMVRRKRWHISKSELRRIKRKKASRRTRRS